MSLVEPTHASREDVLELRALTAEVRAAELGVELAARDLHAAQQVLAQARHEQLVVLNLTKQKYGAEDIALDGTIIRKEPDA